MDVGPQDSASSIIKPMMGKRGMGDVLNEACNKDSEPTYHKLSNVDGEAGNVVYISAGWRTTLA